MKSITVATGKPARSSRRTLTLVALAVAIVGTVAFYLPLLTALQPGNVDWPGFMLAHDQRVFYFPSFVEGYRRFWSGGMLGIDFFTGGGASVYGFRQNLMPFYPPYLLAYLLVDCGNITKAMVAYVLINAAHQFAALFFTTVFARRYLGLPMGAAALCACLFALSHQAGVYIVFATFYFQMLLIPVAACALCWLMRTRSLVAAILVSPLFLTFALTNYGPTMLVSMSVSLAAALLAFAIWPDTERMRDWRVLVPPTVSLAIAVMVSFPYFYGQLRFKSLMAPTADDLVQVAYSLALNGYDLVNALSKHMNVRRSISEGTLVWDALPVFLAVLGIQLMLGSEQLRTGRAGQIAKLALSIYFAMLVVSLGTSAYSASTAFYFLAPVVGKMHIFQRYLIFGQLFVAIAVAAMAALAIYGASETQKRNYAYAGLALWLGFSALLLFWTPPPGTLAIPEFLADLFLVAVAGLVIALARPHVAFAGLAILYSISSLYAPYTLAAAYNKPEQHAVEPSPMDPELQAIVAFLKAHGAGKALSKIIVANPEIESYFNRNLPWLIGSQVKLMNYQGYPPHLSVLAGYATQWSTYGRIDPVWLRQSGIDFVFWNDGAPTVVSQLKADGYSIGATLDLPYGNHLATVALPSAASILDLQATNASAWPRPLAIDGWEISDGRLVKLPGGIENRFGYLVEETTDAPYDIGFDIAPGSQGSLTVAFGNEVVQTFDVAGHTRFDARATAHQAGDLWITASPGFAGSLTNIAVRPVASMATTYDNGVLRVDASSDHVRSFNTNYSSHVRLVLDTPQPAQITYLLWPTPYMAPFVDGQRAEWIDVSAQPLRLAMPAGRHTFELRFVNGAATAFRVTMGLYTVLLALALILVFARDSRAAQRLPALVPAPIAWRIDRSRLAPAWREVRRLRGSEGDRWPWLLGRAILRRIGAELFSFARADWAATVALITLLTTTTLSLLVNFGMVEVLGLHWLGLPYIGELPELRGNDLSRLMAASSGFDPLHGADMVMPGEPVPYPPFAFLLFGALAALPGLVAWLVFYLPAAAQLSIAAWFARSATHPLLKAGWFVAILLVYPFLYVLDRANVDLYVAILCFGAVVLLKRGNTPKAAGVMIGIAAALKIYPLALLALFPRRDRKALLSGIVIAGATTILGLAVLHQNPVEALRFLGENTSRTASCFQDETRCLNLSLAVPFKLAFAGVVTSDWYDAFWQWAYRIYGIASVALAGVAMLYVALRPSRLWMDVLRLTLVMTLVPVMSYDYKLLLFLGPAALALADIREGRVDATRNISLVLMAVLLSSWKWLGQWPHLWIHSVAQLLLLGIAVLPDHWRAIDARQRFAFGRRRLVGVSIAVFVAVLLAWNAVGNDVVREAWARTTSWCPARLSYNERDPFPIWGEGWAGFEGPDGGHWRWTTDRTAEMYLPLRGDTRLGGVVALPPGAPADTVEIRSNAGGSVGIFVPAGGTASFQLDAGREGLAHIEFVAPDLSRVGDRYLGLVVSGLHVEGACGG